MTIDATKPTDQVLVSELPGYIRANRTEINNLNLQGEYAVTTLPVASSKTELVVGTDLKNIDQEIVLISGVGSVTLQRITGGYDGQMKIFIFQDDDVSLVDGQKEDGEFYLNQLPATSTYHSVQDDSLILVNVGGDGTSEDGYWKEVNRQPSVK